MSWKLKITLGTKYIYSIIVANTCRYKYIRVSESWMDIFVNVSYLLFLPVNTGAAWHVHLGVSLQLVKIQVYMSHDKKCKLPVSIWQNTMTFEVNPCVFFVPTVAVVCEAVLFLLPLVEQLVSCSPNLNNTLLAIQQ